MAAHIYSKISKYHSTFNVDKSFEILSCQKRCQMRSLHFVKVDRILSPEGFSIKRKLKLTKAFLMANMAFKGLLTAFRLQWWCGYALKVIPCWVVTFTNKLHVINTHLIASHVFENQIHIWTNLLKRISKIT